MTVEMKHPSVTPLNPTRSPAAFSLHRTATHRGAIVVLLHRGASPATERRPVAEALQGQTGCIDGYTSRRGEQCARVGAQMHDNHLSQACCYYMLGYSRQLASGAWTRKIKQPSQHHKQLQSKQQRCSCTHSGAIIVGVPANESATAWRLGGKHEWKAGIGSVRSCIAVALCGGTHQIGVEEAIVQELPIMEFHM